MEEVDRDLVLPEIHTFTPIRALRITSRKKIAQFLDLDGTLVVCDDTDIVNNYNGLAEMAGFSYLDIRNLMRHKSPTEELLDIWTVKENAANANVGSLWKYLYQMERFDVLQDCRRTILNDCRIYEQNQEIEEAALQYQIEKQEQDPTVTNSEMRVDETRYAAVDDVKTGKQTYFDAFICYTQEDENDRAFVRKMIFELEKERKMKLFVPGRDDLPGAAEHNINAYLIEVRCKRVVILMSRMFLKSPECDFQVKFAHALAPGARSKKLIPVIREKKIPLPRILKFLAVCDFSKSDMHDWVWDRLSTAINAPIGPDTYFEEEDWTDPFQDLNQIQFPSSSRRLEDPAQTVHEASSSSPRINAPPPESSSNSSNSSCASSSGGVIGNQRKSGFFNFNKLTSSKKNKNKPSEKPTGEVRSNLSDVIKGPTTGMKMAYNSDIVRKAERTPCENDMTIDGAMSADMLGTSGARQPVTHIDTSDYPHLDSTPTASLNIPEGKSSHTASNFDYPLKSNQPMKNKNTNPMPMQNKPSGPAPHNPSSHPKQSPTRPPPPRPIPQADSTTYYV